MKKTINHFLSSNLFLRILSVILSVCLWMIVINTNDPMTTRTFSNMEVTITHESLLTDQGKLFKIKEGDKISFSVKGKKSIVDKLKKSDFEVIADLDELSNVNAVPIRIIAKKYASNIDIMYSNDKMLMLTIENAKTKKFPLEVQIQGTPEKGYSVGEAVAKPNSVTITGPESEINQIHHVGVTANVKGLTHNVVASATVVCYDSSGAELDSSGWTFTTNRVKVEISIGQSKKVPVKVKTKGSPASGYQIAAIECTPAKVTLTGKNGAMDGISEIVLPEISVKDAEESITKTIPASEIALPKGASFLQKELEFQVTILINQEAAEEIQMSSADIEVEGLAEDQTLDFLDQKVSFFIYGHKGEKPIDIGEFAPNIEVAGLEPGEYRVNVFLKKMDGITVKENPQIRIRISAAESDEDED